MVIPIEDWRDPPGNALLGPIVEVLSWQSVEGPAPINGTTIFP